MPIGHQVSLSMAQLNIEIGEVGTDFHNAARRAQDFFERINSLGIAGLVNVGFTQPDAQAYFDAANSMNTASKVWFGDVGTPPFNFDDETAKVR